MERKIKPVELTLRALKDLNRIYLFNAKLYGKSIAEEITDNIFKRIEILENPRYDFSEIGVIDTDFLHLKFNYRKLIEQHCKITYREGRTKIYIVRVFDTRQKPGKNK